uniref:Uncharacterized protein n=1 Tax=Molossus molossus TaxID=27622 RepID=A0A7J8J7H2_MOLMO|nr:hypothetical protein HJG59_009683 [Molossus molossus]
MKMTENDKLLNIGTFIYLIILEPSGVLSYNLSCLRVIFRTLLLFCNISFPHNQWITLISTFKQMKHEPGLYLAPKVKFWGKGEQFKLFVETMYSFPYSVFICCHGDLSVSIYWTENIEIMFYYHLGNKKILIQSCF